MRAYCWRVGCVLELEEGSPCDECGAPSHEPYGRDDCGGFAPAAGGKGVHCVLPQGHPGACAPTEESVVEPVMES